MKRGRMGQSPELGKGLVPCRFRLLSVGGVRLATTEAETSALELSEGLLVDRSEITITIKRRNFLCGI